MGDPIQTIVIVGGGTAGWLSAVYLNEALSPSPGTAGPRPRCAIVLVESSDIPTIGVGEATVPYIRDTFAFCGIDEADWLTKCNASFKMAVKFVNWSTKNPIFYNPFDYCPPVRGLPLQHYWLKRKLLGNSDRFDYACLSVPHLCDAKKAPKQGHEERYHGQVRYAYHLDAGLLAAYLKDLAIRRGVTQVVDKVTAVALDDEGHISHLTTQHHGSIHGDLFIDCSGFRGLLINQTLKEPFISFSDSLFCDSAVAIPVATDDEKYGIEPYTTATALTCGWAWKTPLFGRSGNGYVYSSAFITPEDAERELRQHLGLVSDEPPARHIKMRVGRSRNAWVNNCVSIGLSSGFIEPLESTGIFFIDFALFNLIQNFPDKGFASVLLDKYNSIMRSYYEELRDFIVLHYCTTDREDTPFWRENKYHPAIPESLGGKLELWRVMLPSHESVDPTRVFPDVSYVSILAGMDSLPERSLPILSFVDDSEAEEAFKGVRLRASNLSSVLPDHYRYLAAVHRGDFEAARRSEEVDGGIDERLTAWLEKVSEQ